MSELISQVPVAADAPAAPAPASVAVTPSTAKKGKKGGEILAPRFGRVKANLKMGILGLPNVSFYLNILHPPHSSLTFSRRLGKVLCLTYLQNNRQQPKIIHFAPLIPMKADVLFPKKDSIDCVICGSPHPGFQLT